MSPTGHAEAFTVRCRRCGAAYSVRRIPLADVLAMRCYRLAGWPSDGRVIRGRSRGCYGTLMFVPPEQPPRLRAVKGET